MKRILTVFTIVFVFAFLFNACKSKSTTEPSGNVNTGNYFPNGDGTSYKYAVTKTDSNGTAISGQRSTTYKGTTVLSGVTFQNEIDSLTFYGVTTTSSSLFLKSDTAVIFTIDTTGFSSLLPDSLRQYLQYIQVNTSLEIFQFPFRDGQSWPVLNVAFKYGSISLNIASLKAYYQGIQQVSLNLTSGTVTDSAAAVKYVLSLSIPDFTNPLAPPQAYSYSAYAWLVKNIGVVKMQGNGTILSAFTGAGIQFGDTTSTIIQSLKSYNIK